MLGYGKGSLHLGSHHQTVGHQNSAGHPNSVRRRKSVTHRSTDRRTRRGHDQLFVRQPAQFRIAAFQGEQRDPGAPGIVESRQQGVPGGIGRHHEDRFAPTSAGKAGQVHCQVRRSTTGNDVAHQSRTEFVDAGITGLVGQMGAQMPRLAGWGADQEESARLVRCAP